MFNIANVQCRYKGIPYVCFHVRVKVLVFQRTMSPKQVSNVIRQGFGDMKLQTWMYLEASQDGMLSKSTNQEMDGDAVVSRKGSLYLCECKAPEVISDSVRGLYRTGFYTHYS